MATAIQFSFVPETHTYTDSNGVMRPSVSQVIKSEGLISFAGISPSVLERKRQLGTLVHKVTELYDQGEDLNQYEIPEEVWPYFDGWVNFRADCCFEPGLIEHRLLAQVHGMWYGMCLDRRGQIDGVEHIIEVKCGAIEHPAWGVQLAAYALGMEPTTTKQPARAVIQLGTQFPRGYKTHPYTEQSDYTEWLNCLSSSMWKINKRLFSFANEDERMIA
jgi:hypothetical protein